MSPEEATQIIVSLMPLATVIGLGMVVVIILLAGLGLIATLWKMLQGVWSMGGTHSSGPNGPTRREYPFIERPRPWPKAPEEPPNERWKESGI